MSKISFKALGGAGEVGANCYIVDIDDFRLLLDCGLHPKKEGFEALPAFAHLDRAPDAVLVTHAHIDHCGGVPYLVKLYPHVVPYATPATVRIMDRMLHNSVSVMGILKREQGIDEYPLYEHGDVDVALRKAYGIPMYQEFALHPEKDIVARFTPAGHVLGSASIEVRSGDHRLFYTGDICTVDQELMPRFELPDAPNTINTLVIESTYGANEKADHYDYASEIHRLGTNIANVLDEGGSVLIPSFAVGRSQELLNIIDRLQRDSVIPRVPVYASGLGRAVYELYDRFANELRPNSDLAPLSRFERVGDVWDPKVTRKLLAEQSIVVATSGMMIKNTPSALIAQDMVKESHHGIFFVGYCDPDTLGFSVKHAKPGDRLQFVDGGEKVKMVLENIDSYHFSAHAPRKALLEVAEAIDAETIIFVHGDPDAVEWMENNCGNGARRYIPATGEEIVLQS